MVNCEKQTKIKDEITSEPIWKTAEFFAQKDSLAKWHTEFLNSYGKMMTNGNNGLVQQSMPMAHGCECFIGDYNILSNGKVDENGNKLTLKRAKNVKSAKDCFDKCKEQKGCNEFLYKEHFQQCDLFSKLIKNKDTIQTGAHRFIVYGSMDKCKGWTDADFEQSCKVFMTSTSKN